MCILKGSAKFPWNIYVAFMNEIPGTQGLLTLRLQRFPQKATKHELAVKKPTKFTISSFYVCTCIWRLTVEQKNWYIA